jgi:cold shock CspA family protein/ribosome-associated translation inhibitor RaiA
MEETTMQLPEQIAFRNMEPSAAIEDEVRDRVEWLDEFCRDIMGCRVVVEVPHRHHQRGNQYLIRIDLTVPGEEIAVTREPPEHDAYRDVNVAIRDAFDTARRRLEDYVRRRRQDVKAHEEVPHAWVTQLFPVEDYGFLRTADNRDIYFHRHSVLHDAFDRLAVGTEVTFVEEEGKKGSQASTVRIAGRHHQA